MDSIEKGYKAICFWSQYFPNYYDLQLKNGLPQVLKAGPSGKHQKFFKR
jgi:hypothetical protein